MTALLPEDVDTLAQIVTVIESSWVNINRSSERHAALRRILSHLRTEASAPPPPTAAGFVTCVGCMGAGRFSRDSRDICPRCSGTGKQAAPPAPSGWQPIESAPKGRKVLVAYRNALGNWRRVCAHYYPDNTLENDPDISDDEFAAAGWYETCEASDHTYPVEREPERWCELPPAPTTEGKSS